MKKSHPQYSVVIPVYNSEQTLEALASRLGSTFARLGKSYEVIFVDDASPNENTWPTLMRISKSDSHVKSYRLTRNFGQQAATICGLRQALGSFVITMDDDLQHLPEDIPVLIAKQNHDAVIAQFKTKQHGLSKRIFSRTKGYFDSLILGKPKDIQLSAFRLINRSTLNGMVQLFNTPYPFIPAMLFYVTKDVVGATVPHGNRVEGESGYTLKKMVRIFSNLLINNSSIMLRILGNLGLGMSAISFMLAMVFIVRRLTTDSIPAGWTSVIVTLLFIGGLLLFSVGMLGEYLIRIIRGVDQRPNYIVREFTKHHEVTPNDD